MNQCRNVVSSILISTVITLGMFTVQEANSEDRAMAADELCTGLTLAASSGDSDEYYSAVFDTSERSDEAMSTDGRIRLSVNSDGSVTVTDLVSGEVRTLSGPIESGLCGTWGCGGVLQADFSADGAIAVTSTSLLGGATTIWNAKTWKKVRNIPGGAFALSSDGRYIATFDTDSKFGDALYVTDIRTGDTTVISGDYWTADDTRGTGLALNGNTQWYVGGVDGFAFIEGNVLIAAAGFKQYAVYDPIHNRLAKCGYNPKTTTTLIQVPERYKNCESPYPAQTIKDIGEYFDIDGDAVFQFYCVLKNAILNRDRQLLSNMTEYPIDIHIGKKYKRIYSAEEFVRHYEAIVNSKIYNAIEKQRFDQIFYKSTGLMVGNGEIWFSARCRDNDKPTASAVLTYDTIKETLGTRRNSGESSTELCNYFVAITAIINGD